jgi:hypothetical protein
LKSPLTLELLTKLLLSLSKRILIALIPEVRQLLVQNVCIPALNALPCPLSTRTAKSLRATLTGKLSRYITKSLLTLTPDLLLNLLSNLLLIRIVESLHITAGIEAELAAFKETLNASLRPTKAGKRLLDDFLLCRN